MTCQRGREPSPKGSALFIRFRILASPLQFLDFLLQQFDPLFVLVGFFLDAGFAAGIGKFLISFNQDRGVGWRVFVVAKLFSQFKNDFTNLFVLADQRGAFFSRSAKHQTTEVFPIAKNIKALWLEHQF